jgi:hypothetical protein
MSAAKVLAAAALAVGLILVAYLDASGSWRLPVSLDRASHGWLLHYALLLAAPVTTVLMVHWADRRTALITATIAGLGLAVLIGIESLPTAAACGASPGMIVVIASGAAIYVIPALAGIVAAGSAPEYRAWPLVIGATLSVGNAAILFFIFVGATFGPICPTPRL